VNRSTAPPEDEYLLLLFDEAADGLFFADSKGFYFKVNRSGHRMLGYEDGELIGKHITSVIPEHEVSHLKSVMEKVAQGNILTEFWEMLRKDGKLIHIELRAQQLSNGTLLGVVREPAARDSYERQLQSSEARLWSILQTAPDIILTVDRDGKIIFINRVVPPATMEQVVGANSLDFVPEESRARVAQAIEHVFTTREFDEYEVRRPPDVNGQQGWSAVRVGPMFKGDEVVAVTMCATDISAYKLESVRKQEALDRLSQVASLVPGMVFQFKRRPDGSACFPYVSEQVRTIFGLSPESIVEDGSRVFALFHPDDVPGAFSALDDSTVTGKPIYYEFRILIDGKTKWVSGYAASPAKDADGSTVWHGFCADITERKEAEQIRSRLEEQLLQSQKMESIGQLAGGVAHDFNNLLTIISGFAKLTMEDLPAQSPLQTYLDGIKNAALRGSTLTQQLVAFARKKIVQPENVDLNLIATQLAPMIRRLVGEHIQLDLQLKNQLPLVKVDVGSMEQVLMNLVVNARDAMTSGGRLLLETSSILIDEKSRSANSVLDAREYVLLSVTDSGTGMSDEARLHLFEPFYTTKPQGSGTGLGLAMCHGIINQAGGSIAVDSEIGKGTTIKIYLPSLPDDAALSPPRNTPVKEARGHETLLLVEDEPMILQLISRELEKLGYIILSANDGIEALEVVKQTTVKIDLVVTDVVMPRLGGRELVTRLQQQQPGIKALFMSGYAENAIAHQGELQRGLHFIQKPYSPDELARRIREVLDAE
jgi:two-component system cell cycle sensor histidine kinase/response regulator CckA